MVLSEMFNLQAKGHRRTSNTKMQNHGPQETPDFRTSRRPYFILDVVLDPKPMALPPPSLNPATPTHTLVLRSTDQPSGSNTELIQQLLTPPEQEYAFVEKENAKEELQKN
ncbi:hypothetical protein Tco_0921195 [Tanacetum coccineum]